MKVGRTQVIIGILIALALILLTGGGYWQGPKLYQKLIKQSVDREVEQATKGFQDEIDRLNSVIKEKDAQLRISEQRYQNLLGKIKAKAQEGAAIKKPEGNNETKKRFSDLGYKPLR
jgi:hypothetical protein